MEALVLARYYMFTVYFNVTGKAWLHLNEWLAEQGAVGRRTEAFLLEDDVSVLAEMRLGNGPHARAVTHREQWPLAFQTDEHISAEERHAFENMVPDLRERFGAGNILVSNSSKDPHRLGRSGVQVRRFDGDLEPMEQASQFIRHLTRIERYRVYTPGPLRSTVAQEIHRLWHPAPAAT